MVSESLQACCYDSRLHIETPQSFTPTADKGGIQSAKIIASTQQLTIFCTVRLFGIFITYKGD